MNRQVLCIGDSTQPQMTRRRALLEDAGFLVLHACDELQAAELLKSQRVDVVCIDAGSVGTHGTGVGANIKSVRPEIPIILLRDCGTLPARFEEFVDVIIDKATFDATTQWLIEELSDVRFPVVPRCFDEPTRRSSER